MAACVNAVEGKRKKKKEKKRREAEKLANSSALLIAETQYDLFRNMQIQKSLCLVYQREPLKGGTTTLEKTKNRSSAHLPGRDSFKIGKRTARESQRSFASASSSFPLVSGDRRRF